MVKNYLLQVGLIFSIPLAVFAQSDFDCSTLNPVVEVTEINVCEPGGGIHLEAQTNAGNKIYWYDSIDADDPVGKGTHYDAGVISTDTSFWVSEVHEDLVPIPGQGRVTPNTMSGAGQANMGLGFTADEAFKIISVDVFSMGDAGEAVIQLREGATVLEAKTVNIPAGSSDNPLKHTINLDFELPSAGDYTLLLQRNSDLLVREIGTAQDFPIGLADVGRITGGRSAGLFVGINDHVTYFWFYNWEIEAVDMVCESDRKEIKINVNDDYPEVPAIDSEYVLCGDADFSLSDIQIEDTNELQWYDEEGNDLSEDTVIEEGVVYLAADLSVGGCLSEFAEVTFVYQDISDTPLAETSQTFEEDSGADLTSLEVEGENLRWYADEDKEEELPEDTLLEDGMTYYVSQTLEEHCESDLIGITVTETLGVADVYFEGLKYNNPVQDILYLSNDIEIESVTVYDLSGRQLSVATDKLSSNELRMDLSGLSAGVYFFNLHVNEDTKMIKIVKQ